MRPLRVLFAVRGFRQVGYEATITADHAGGVQGDHGNVGTVLKQAVTYGSGTTLEADGVPGKGDEIVRTGGVIEAVHDVRRRADFGATCQGMFRWQREFDSDVDPDPDPPATTMS